MVPDSHGAQSNVTVLVDGSPRATRNGVVGAQQEFITVPSNETNFAVALRVCNENAARGGCTDSEPQRVQTYGPLGDRHITSVSPNVNGRQVSWTISGTSNGDPVVIEYQVPNEPLRRFRPEGPGAFSFFTPNTQTARFDQETSIFVSISDDNPGGRGTGQRYEQTRSGPPPPVNVSVSRGPACRDGDPSWTGPACQPTPEAEPCTETNCAFIAIAVSGFVQSYSCVIHRRHRPDITFQVDGGGNYSSQSYYYGVGALGFDPNVSAYCESDQQAGSSQVVSWPPATPAPRPTLRQKDTP